MDKKLTKNYHTHTYRCGHAVGKDEDYVLKAIEQNFKVLGFSDHIPFPNLPQKNIRQNSEDINGYISSINYLKEKYKDKIEIHVGYEAEYVSKFKDYYLDLKRKGIEYFILGQHCTINEKNEYVWSGSDRSLQNVIDYVDTVIKAMNTNIFTYVAHPDLILANVDEITDEMMLQMKRIVLESIRLNIPLEINLGGVRNKTRLKNNNMIYQSEHYYPFDQFFKLVGELGAPVVIGVDHHDPIEIEDVSAINKAFELVDKYNLKLVDNIVLK